MEESKSQITIPDSDLIRRKIYTIRNNQVMLDSDLAMFYRVETKQLNQTVKRNINRFPKEFMYQLNENEWESLRSQNVTLDEHTTFLRSQNAILEKGRGKHCKYLPFAFLDKARK